VLALAVPVAEMFVTPTMWLARVVTPVLLIVMAPVSETGFVGENGDVPVR
jgi:hypothetical protein